MKKLARVIEIFSIFIVVLVFTIILFAKPILLFIWVQSYKWVYNIDDFDEYHEDLLTVANFCRDFFEDGRYDRYDPAGDKLNYITYKRGYKDRKCSLLYDAEEIPLPEDIQKAAERINEAFDDPDAFLETIDYYEGRISFQTFNGQYALVYSFNDKKPTFLLYPEEEKKIYVKKIEKYWYNVVRKPE